MVNDYEVLAEAPVSPSRTVVVSKHRPSGGYTLAQRFDANDGGDKTVQLFMKGAFHIDHDGLYQLRDAIDKAISKIESSN